MQNPSQMLSMLQSNPALAETMAKEHPELVSQFAQAHPQMVKELSEMYPQIFSQLLQSDPALAGIVSQSGSSSGGSMPNAGQRLPFPTQPNVGQPSSTGSLSAFNANTSNASSISNPPSSVSSIIQTSGGQQVLATHQNTVQGIPSSHIPQGQEGLYILKSEIVPPVCPACPAVTTCPRQKPCQPCPPCDRCPEPAFDCKKVPNYRSSNQDYLPRPVLNDFSQFGM